MKRKSTAPAGLTGPPINTEHNCFPLHVDGKLVATCGRHYGQPPVLRGSK